MDSGNLVPDDLVVNMMASELKKIQDLSWLLDGFPRTKPQAMALQKVTPVNVVINIDVPFQTIIDRVKGNDALSIMISWSDCIFSQIVGFTPHPDGFITLYSVPRRSQERMMKQVTLTFRPLKKLLSSNICFRRRPDPEGRWQARYRVGKTEKVRPRHSTCPGFLQGDGNLQGLPGHRVQKDLAARWAIFEDHHSLNLSLTVDFFSLFLVHGLFYHEI